MIVEKPVMQLASAMQVEEDRELPGADPEIAAAILTRKAAIYQVAAYYIERHCWEVEEELFRQVVSFWVTAVLEGDATGEVPEWFEHDVRMRLKAGRFSVIQGGWCRESSRGQK